MEDDEAAKRAVLDEITHDIDVLLAVHGSPNSFATWRAAWCAAMQTLGYPAAELTCHYRHEHDDDDNIVNTVEYGWCHDVDAYNQAWLTRDHFHCDQVTWQTAHYVFLLVDRLRPEYITPSSALAEMLDAANAAGDN